MVGTTELFQRAVQEGLVRGNGAVSSISSSGFGPKSEPWEPVFLANMSRGLSVRRACKVTGVDLALVYQRRNADPAFAKRWAEATHLSTQALVDEAVRRAHHGEPVPLMHKGERVGTVRKYSDVLLMFLIKQRDASFREAYDAAKGQDSTVQINVQVNTVEGPPGTPRRAEVIVDGGSAAPVLGSAVDVQIAMPLESPRIDASGVSPPGGSPLP